MKIEDMIQKEIDGIFTLIIDAEKHIENDKQNQALQSISACEDLLKHVKKSIKENKLPKKLNIRYSNANALYEGILKRYNKFYGSEND